jgi:UDPglucose 6-dehydrogenase
MARIFIMGSGVVGAATGKGFLATGHEVTFIDISEPRLAELTHEGLDARRELDLRAEPAAFVFLTLPTPNIGNRYDLAVFDAGTAAVGAAIADAATPPTVVVRSTVPPGTTEKLVQPTLDKYSGTRVGEGYFLAANPEFLRAACAVEDFRWPWITVIASRSARTRERLSALLTPFGGELRAFDDPAVVEFIKCTHNIFNATKISFWNQMWLVAQEIGLDLDPIAETVAVSAEGSFNPRYGIRGGAPYGGACLPKDILGFLGFVDEIDVDMPLLNAVVEVNERLKIMTTREGGPLALLDGETGAEMVHAQRSNTSAPAIA